MATSVAQQSLPAGSPAAADTLIIQCPISSGTVTSHEIQKLLEDLTSHGEITQFGVSDLNELVVSFFDTRAANAALKAFGASARPDAQNRGVYTVWLPGAFPVEEDEVSGVVAIQSGPVELFAVTFHDCRMAQKAVAGVAANGALLGLSVEPPVVPTQPKQPEPEAVRDCSEAVVEIKLSPQEVPDASVEIRPARLQQEGPRCISNFRTSEVRWNELASGLDKRTTLRLRFLPARLCAPQAFVEALEKGGVVDSVDCFRVVPSQGAGRVGLKPGSALVNAVNHEAVVAVAKYFHGRQWGRSNVPVSVSFAELQGRAELERAMPLTLPCGLHARRVIGAGRVGAPRMLPRMDEVGSESLATTAEPGDSGVCSTQASSNASHGSPSCDEPD